MGCLPCFSSHPKKQCTSLPKPSGPFPVGVRDLRLQVPPGENVGKGGYYVFVRITYPADLQGPGPQGLTTGYLAKGREQENLAALVKGFAYSACFAPVLKHWKNVELDAARDAALLAGESRPVVLFSHGQCGGWQLYSTLTTDLASQGSVVVAVDHTDGSSPYVEMADSNFPTAAKVLPSAQHNNECKAAELLGALGALRAQAADPDSFLFRCLDLDRVALMGHSSGGAAVITAMLKQPEAFRAVVLMEPMFLMLTDEMKRTWMHLVCKDDAVGCKPPFYVRMANIVPPTEPPTDDVAKLLLCARQIPIFQVWSEAGERMGFELNGYLKTATYGGHFGLGSAYCGLVGTAHGSFSDVPHLLPPKLLPGCVLELTNTQGKREDTPRTARALRRILAAFLEEVGMLPGAATTLGPQGAGPLSMAKSEFEAAITQFAQYQPKTTS